MIQGSPSFNTDDGGDSLAQLWAAYGGYLLIGLFLIVTLRLDRGQGWADED